MKIRPYTNFKINKRGLIMKDNACIKCENNGRCDAQNRMGEGTSVICCAGYKETILN